MPAMAGYPRVLTRRPRHRLIVERDRLHGSDPAGRVTIITGPAGTGKSVLASQIADRLGARLAWCRLAPGWNRATDIAGMTSASLEAEQVDVGDDLHAAADAVLGLLEEEPTCLVVDDLHEGEGGQAEHLLAEVASFLPENSAIVVTSRRRPAELIGMVEPSMLHVMDAEALAFDVEETKILFDARGITSDATRARDLTNGWIAALVAATDAGTDDTTRQGGAGFETVVGAALSPDKLGPLWPAAEASAVLPYVSGELLQALECGDLQTLEQLAEHTSLLVETAGQWRLHASAAELVEGRIDDHRRADLRSGAAHFLAESDAITAIELFIEASDSEAAGDLLAARASEIGPSRATRWLYQLPADVRRRLPPVLASGRATVNVNLAIEMARRTVDTADDSRTRREGLLGLGSLLLAEGDLGDAAEALEAAHNLAGGDRQFAASAGEQLATTRWLAGDNAGAAAAMKGIDDHPWVAWLRAVIALLDGDPDAAADAARLSVDLADGANVTDGPGNAVLAAVALTTTGPGDAAPIAEQAYQTALEVGGRDLAAAAPVHGWCLIGSGADEEALAVAEQVERTIGRHDQAARLHAALMRRAITARSNDESERQRADRRVDDLRSRGLAPIERFADLLAASCSPSEQVERGLRVEYCGAFRLLVDGQPLEASAWKSKKAQEVCAYVCHAGPSGLRREQVIEAIWAGRDPEKGRTLLRTALSEIRRVLEPRRGAGQESRFVSTSGDRVVVTGASDLAEAESLSEAGDHQGAFALLAARHAPDLPDSDWAHELVPQIERGLIESAARVASSSASHEMIVLAFERLIEIEPWQRDHFDGLVAAYKNVGDDLSAEDVDRRWFADD